MQTPEQRVQNTIEANLKKFQKRGEPLFFEKRQAGGWNYKKGMPDLYVVYKGIHYEFEIKKPGGKASNLQLAWQKKFRERYQIEDYIVCSWEEIKEILKLPE